jgi:hypothetical protein
MEGLVLHDVSEEQRFLGKMNIGQCITLSLSKIPRNESLLSYVKDEFLFSRGTGYNLLAFDPLYEANHGFFVF